MLDAARLQSWQRHGFSRSSCATEMSDIIGASLRLVMSELKQKLAAMRVHSLTEACCHAYALIHRTLLPCVCTHYFGTFTIVQTLALLQLAQARKPWLCFNLAQGCKTLALLQLGSSLQTCFLLCSRKAFHKRTAAFHKGRVFHKLTIVERHHGIQLNCVFLVYESSAMKEQHCLFFALVLLLVPALRLAIAFPHFSACAH